MPNASARGRAAGVSVDGPGTFHITAHLRGASGAGLNQARPHCDGEWLSANAVEGQDAFLSSFLPIMSTDTCYLRLNAVMQRTRLAKSTIYKPMRQRQFPAARKLTPKAVGWSESEIASWLASRSSS